MRSKKAKFLVKIILGHMGDKKNFFAKIEKIFLFLMKKKKNCILEYMYVKIMQFFIKFIYRNLRLLLTFEED